MTLSDGQRGQRSSGVVAPADHVSLRRHNLAVVLRHIRDAGPRSRARIASDTGLNKATVSSLVAELVDRGLLREAEAERGAVGRPGQLVELDGRRVCGVGAEVNVDYLAVTALDLTGGVIIESRVPFDAAHLGSAATFDRLEGLIEEALQAIGTRGGQPVGVTLAVPGLVQSAAGTLALAPNLGWEKVDVVQAMTERLGNPTYKVSVDNEANLAALAAYAEIAAADPTAVRDLVLLTGAVGVGGGVVAGGQLLRGGHGFSGEVGHIPVAPAGRRCGCGRTGCWETVIGLTALLDKATEPDDPVRDVSLDVEQRLAEITRRAEAGDERTLAALADVGTWLGLGGAILVNILNPDVLVLGGYFGALGPWLTAPLEEAIRDRVIAPDGGGCRVLRSGLGFTAAVRGGAQISLDSVFDDPTQVPTQVGASA
ncbi:ROK family transcriptional regulator [Kribbella sp. NBC_01245]|uniref:ROK family transcriptional regulator n=1 Tax=Kribbella sp. NBC_01245 TaxID=2903578 RepID=UPI002E2DB9D1|nr:ROK family transcriptional regulator [Kribbella sp. NBC_01245]